MKAILLLLDGLGDRPQQALGGRTPLEAAYTPNLDNLCSMAETGMMIPWRQGVPLGTEAAHFCLFGYDMGEFPGRGIINALSRDIQVEENAVYLATSWASVQEEEGLFIQERWTSQLTKEEVVELQDMLPPMIDGIYFCWQYSVGPHGVLTLKGDNASEAISDSDPFYDDGYVMEVEAFETEEKKAYITAQAINTYLRKVYRQLKHHPVNKKRVQEGKKPANFLLTKWAGKKPNLLSFQDKHGMKGAIVGASRLMYGIAKLLGMEYIPYNSFQEGVRSALNSDFEFLHLHTKEPDEAAHTKNPFNKVKVLEEIDKQIAPLVEAVKKQEMLVIVTGDHTTPSSGGMIHSGEAIPIMFAGKNVRVDEVASFGERSCTKGSIRMTGNDLMQMVLNYTDKALFYNFRPGGRRLNHIPKTIKKLKP
ncbi:2,3-bisphosphoglycerate-independent phosphoglycerate mutase [Natronincola peptidivorans]|uniref:2,3-bisphosphoglycerate-independent phosphoglycerate mutase n=1 Tax=Natronincola peptidivorans TaxID=426128 RepID=A0A1I0D8U8_9FIRM|nr:2,3-bisphosphoglycerate-independent phosphoglycerate mutase [Natronincola peptidivorans]SET28496.1 2,3-bisphosphoglycerate-independent phosphoglycerate mutase [Natronincola peptidivorans]